MKKTKIMKMENSGNGAKNKRFLSADTGLRKLTIPGMITMRKGIEEWIHIDINRQTL